MLAGVYKRRWWDDPTRRRDLEESHRLYRGAWERQPVGVGNPYPGINAAATARWLGDRTGALALAGQVYALLTTREATLAVLRPGHRTPDDYWDRVTLAEAHLLLERPEEARRVYREAFRAHAQRLSDIGASLGQAARLLATQYGEDESARFVASLTVVDTEEP